MENSESSLIIECSESKPDVIFKDRTIYPLPVSRSWKQSHFIEVAQGAIFMEQNTLESGINVALRLLIFWHFSRGYGLIPDSIEPILVV
jgi:hypothetical protein